VFTYKAVEQEKSMTRIYKKTIRRAIPAGAEIVKGQNGKKYAVYQHQRRE
jgi:hypothetical protein